MSSLQPALRLYVRAEATVAMRRAAEVFEKKFAVKFATVSYFPKELLARWHSVQAVEGVAHQIASVGDSSLIADIGILTAIANESDASREERKRYYETLLGIYQKLPVGPNRFVSDPEAVFVGIEREGRLLAESLGCLGHGRSLHPHAKRIPFKGGLLVGLTEIELPQRYSRCVIVDGAIASGATVIAVIERLRNTITSFHIFSAHATQEGLRAIACYAVLEHLDVEVVVGHASEGINDHFYATLPEDRSKVIVGDLGDTISPVVSYRS